MIKVTLEFATAAEAAAALLALQNHAINAEDDATRNAMQAKRNATAKAPVTATEVVAAENAAAAAAAAATKPESEGTTAQQLTNAIVAAVARVGRDKTIDLLKTQFKVSAGKEITDPDTRAKAIAQLGKLVA